MLLRELEAVAPRATVLTLDARDMVMQLEPIGAMLASSPPPCQLTLVGDCACVAEDDKCAERMGRSVSRPSSTF